MSISIKTIVGGGIIQVGGVDRVTIDGDGSLSSLSTVSGNITTSGDITANSALLSSGLTLNKGVTFPATQIPSSDPNTLDDYDEGTWNLTVTAQTGTLTSYTVTSASYVKIGSLVCASFDFTITNNGTATILLSITTPFTVAVSNHYSLNSAREIASAGHLCQVIPIANTATAQILKYDNTYPGGTNFRISGCIQYTVA